MLGNMDSQGTLRSVGITDQNATIYAYTANTKLAKEYDTTDFAYDKIADNSDKKNYGALITNSPFGPLVSAVDLDQKDLNKKYKKIDTPIKIVNTETGLDKVLNYYYVAKGDSKEELTWNNLTEKGINGDLVPVPVSDPNQYQWNLPPHKWSLPVFPSSNSDSTPKGFSKNSGNDRYRRGRIWWRYSDEKLRLITAGNSNGISVSNENRKYGFQFLWNPESFSTAVAVQMDATPNSNDRFLGTVGAFPATETISFNIRLDRTNDFACANNLFKRPTEITLVQKSPNFITEEEVERFIPFYNNGFSSVGKTNSKIMQAKLVELFQRGTIADIEFLYRAINGSGPGENTMWKNPRGVSTADIGFLQPTLLNIDIGPLSYQGYVTSMSVAHIGFTQDMTPIRSDVQITLNLLATAGVTSNYAQSQIGK